jgi:hypothetical protein
MRSSGKDQLSAQNSVSWSKSIRKATDMFCGQAGHPDFIFATQFNSTGIFSNFVKEPEHVNNLFLFAFGGGLGCMGMRKVESLVSTSKCI